MSKDQCRVGVHDAALVADGTSACALNLVYRLATHLPHPFNHQLQARHAGFRQQATRCVDGQIAANLNAAVFNKTPAFALLTEAVGFQRHQRSDGEAVVDLRHINVLGRQPGHLECGLRRQRGGGGGQVRAQRDFP